jgi:hypothetical protein
MRPIMNTSQAEQEEEISGTIQRLSILKLVAASKGDRNKFNIVCKQQIQAAMQAENLIRELQQELQDRSK